MRKTGGARVYKPRLEETEPIMIDPFGRAITYLRVSVTDRCDLRCVYCMAEDMTFLPKKEILTPRGAGPALRRLHRARAPTRSA